MCSEVGGLELLREKFIFQILIGLDRLVTGLPVSWANLTVLISELEAFDQSDSFVDGSADRVIVDGHRAHNSFRVNDKDTSQGSPVHLVVLVLN
jgi:hypothetical protein